MLMVLSVKLWEKAPSPSHVGLNIEFFLFFFFAGRSRLASLASRHECARWMGEFGRHSQ